MARNMLGMLIGAAIDRADGDSGIKGAVSGYLIEGAVKAVVPLAITFAIGWGVQAGLRRGLRVMSSALEASVPAKPEADQLPHARSEDRSSLSLITNRL